MSTSTHLENTIPRAATPPQKKEEFAASTQTASTEAASASGMPEPRSYAVSLGANASAVLVAYGIAVDLHTKGVLYGLSVGKQKVIQLRTADHPSSSELKHHVLQFAKGESGVSVRSLEEIGKALGFDKSTISRRLNSLPYHLRANCF